MKTRYHEILFEGLVVKVEQMEVQVGSKGWHTFQIVRHPGGVAVVPLHSDGTVTLIRQYRPAIGAVTIELPAGRLDPGESPILCGARELAEETGLKAENLVELGAIHSSPGVFDETVHLFLATGLVQHQTSLEEFEEIETLRVPLVEAVAMATDGRISDTKTIAGLLRTARRSP